MLAFTKLDGQSGCGRSTVLAQVIQHCIQAGWTVIHVANGEYIQCVLGGGNGMCHRWYVVVVAQHIVVSVA